MNQLSRFFLVGGLSTLIDYAIFSIAVLCDIYYMIAITLGYMIGFIIHFLMSKKHVFTLGSKIKHPVFEIVTVFVIALLGLGLNIFIVWILSNYIHFLDLFSSRIIAIVIVFFWGYFARKIFVYH